MTTPRYGPPDGHESPRFSGIRTFMRLPFVSELAGVDVAIVGVPFDTATSFRPGARFGPASIRAASVLLRPYHAGHRIGLFEHLSVIDYGDASIVPGNVERTYTQIADALAPLLDGCVVPIVLGGDHSITLAELRVLAAKHGPLALVQLDAHGDTWDQYFGEKYSHGTTFRRAVEEGLLLPARSVQAGLRGSLYHERDLQTSEELGFRVVRADELQTIGDGFGELVHERVGDAPVFLSFDIDFVDPAFAPATGTPEVGGFTSRETVHFLRQLAGLNIVGCDCVEVAPAYDSPGEPTAILAANVVWELLALLAVRRREGATAARHIVMGSTSVADQ
jgi:agmatinase